MLCRQRLTRRAFPSGDDRLAPRCAVAYGGTTLDHDMADGRKFGAYQVRVGSRHARQGEEHQRRRGASSEQKAAVKGHAGALCLRDAETPVSVATASTSSRALCSWARAPKPARGCRTPVEVSPFTKPRNRGRPTVQRAAHGLHIDRRFPSGVDTDDVGSQLLADVRHA